ncbi:MAG: hypothetical protein KTV68_15660 [Acidimicrobiia bacterium]|nr:hypothetical protein [Acidimicrobiia bacterium]MCY4435512.1 hypothetical protein [bacterium]
MKATKLAHTDEPNYGEIVEFPGGGGTFIRGTVHEIYGFPPRRHVIILLTPEISGEFVVDKPSTVSWPLEGIRRSPHHA